ncbi:MAG TPA: DUF4089 domain-containing protein [Rubrivivax sp.]|jgi:hypothetical protein|nr:DUF4089 domain-containing protein [Rubrivivax sp.]
MDSKTIEQQVDATAALIGLPIAPEHREGVLRYFGIAAGLAALVMAQPMATEDEPAALFVPVEPGERAA